MSRFTTSASAGAVSGGAAGPPPGGAGGSSFSARPPAAPLVGAPDAGTLLVVVLWLAAATAFSLYVRHFGGYTVTYGSLAGIILTLVFFYLLAAIFVFGAEFNGALARAEGGLPPPRRRKEDRRPEPRRKAPN